MRPATSFLSPSSSCDHRRNGRTATGCLSRILRRILCFSGLPLCSFDHFKLDEREREVVNGAPGATPGVVARLMGLDSLPCVEPSEESPLSGLADSFKTSCSPQVRRQRDIPAYQELEDDKFFILSFEKRHGSRRRRKSSGTQQSVEENSKREKSGRGERLEGKNKENEDPRNLDSRIMENRDSHVENRGNLLPLLRNSCNKSEKITTKTAKRDCFGNEGDSENSSPNSVLEFVGFSADQESDSPGEISRLANSKMRRPLSEELESCGDSNGKIMLDGLDLEGGYRVKSRRRDRNYAEKLDEVGKLAATETMRSSWLYDEIWKNKHCFMEIGREIASNIFDHLFEELVIDFEQF
ncbi:hypothetical protein C2S53_005264 [Perilla frutescens var. hirtella]|uniref:DUF3741 domain-containing protein n=1 Tax=Perilla frutescens var. hirtella TaxID=608512 RepID=A0AAD4JMN1_PERFH|nr:hypothetical protein C2S53_005264 [Perilla frutescens var. hirtella]